MAQGLAGAQSVGTIIFYVVFYTPFPILLLWLIGRQSAKNDLSRRDALCQRLAGRKHHGHDSEHTRH